VGVVLGGWVGGEWGWFGGGGGGDGGHVLRETTSRCRCELVCPSRTNERGGGGYCVKEGEGEEGERELFFQ